MYKSSKPTYSSESEERGRSCKKYSVKHEILSSFANSWQNHLLSTDNRGQPMKLPWDCSSDYLEWFHLINHPFVHSLKNMRTRPIRRQMFLSHNRNKAVDEALKLLDVSINEGGNVDKVLLLSRQNKVCDLLHGISLPMTFNDVDADPDSGEVGGGSSELRTKKGHDL